MEVKYEAVFGDQELLSEAGIFTGLDVVTRNVDTDRYSYCRREDLTYDYLRKNPVVAMRRIIRTSTWSVADQKAGKLPEVGCLVVNETGKVSEVATIKNGYFVLFECGKRNGPLTIHGDLLMKQFKPIESPEEKAARLREEWINTANSMNTFEIYDALLSGDLPVPVKEQP